jgi:hypothetical protein
MRLDDEQVFASLIHLEPRTVIAAKRFLNKEHAVVTRKTRH